LYSSIILNSFPLLSSFVKPRRLFWLCWHKKKVVSNESKFIFISFLENTK
jgi:hypothetical protein